MTNPVHTEITAELVDRIAVLARLRLSTEERAIFPQQLAAIVGYVEQLGELDTSGVEPLAHPLPIANVFREDEPTASLSPEDALRAAPKTGRSATGGRFYSVPAVLE